MPRKFRALPPSPFRRFNSSPEVIRRVVMTYVRFPLSLGNVEDVLIERGIDVCHETVRHWQTRFGPPFVGDIRRQRVSRKRGFRHWHWHLDEMSVKLSGEMAHLWRAVDHGGEVLESYVTKTSDSTLLDARNRFDRYAFVHRHSDSQLSFGQEINRRSDRFPAYPLRETSSTPLYMRIESELILKLGEVRASSAAVTFIAATSRR